jgi:hypothetical protein
MPINGGNDWDDTDISWYDVFKDNSVFRATDVHTDLTNERRKVKAPGHKDWRHSSTHTLFRHYSSHQIACFKATEGLHLPCRAAQSQQYSDDSFVMLPILSCLYSPGLRCSCCNVVRFSCDLEVCNLVTGTTAYTGLIKSMNVHCARKWDENEHYARKYEKNLDSLWRDETVRPTYWHFINRISLFVD